MHAEHVAFSKDVPAKEIAEKVEISPRAEARFVAKRLCCGFNRDHKPRCFFCKLKDFIRAA